MSGHGYKVPPRSIRNIREIAEGVRKIVGDPRKNIGMFSISSKTKLKVT